ncbi:volume-regulated anion channel subunit LRRC8D isoform X2 [Silurus meridionalis]|uniref:volume-regulated anion channel subunit LRRC8D isoform X2 n=1 Tax=Silurus meridionalis TaxID=175797 RepID=UPI001EEA483E|nr:volume-regulated anion channel subunit LRRC8D isoform X2 [Silurus meridionalis]
MFTLSELWSVTEKQGHYKLLKPWWEVFLDYLVLLMLMVSILSGTLLLSRDEVVCVPIRSTSSNSSFSFGISSNSRASHTASGVPVPRSLATGIRTDLDYQQYVYVSAVCYHEALPWFSRFLPYVTLLQSLLLLASGSFWFHFPLTSARIEHFLTVLAKCCESPWTSRALSHAAKLDRAHHGHPSDEDKVARPQVPHIPKLFTRQSSLDSGTDSPLLARTGSSSAQPSPSPSSLSHCSTVSSLLILEPAPLHKTATILPEGSSTGPTLDRSDGEQARALFERVRRFRAHCESSNIIYKVYTAQTVFKVLMFIVIVSYTTPLLGSISFTHICQPHSHALTGYQTFQCSHLLSSVLRKLMKAYICLMGFYGLLGIYTLFWIFHNETRLMEENLERRWNAARLRSMITYDHKGCCLLQLVAVPYLPPALFTLSQLEVLKLELIRDAKLTAQISKMTALRELHLYHCTATVDSGALAVLQERLESLHLTFNQAAEIPGWVYSLRGLQELHLSGRVASEGTISRGWALGSLRYLRHLRVLALHGTLQKIPSELSEVAGTLVHLEIHNDGARLLVLTGLRRLVGLTDLELQGCQLERLPSALLALTGLRSLDLQHNSLRTLEELLGLQHLRRLSSLRLAHNRILAVPTSVGVLRALELLDLAHNELRNLPPALFTIYRLRRLLLAGNLLEELPAEVGALTLLTELDLSRNRLERLPGALFTNCKELRILNLATNSLGSLNTGLGFLRHLSKLDVQGNNLEELPVELGSCSGLRGGGLLVESWLLHTLPCHIRTFLQQPSCTSSETNSRPCSDIFPALSAAQWSFLSSVESRI